MKLKGSKTEQNLMTAFAGESQARNKYTYFASKARKDGFEQIADIFEETANNEKEHAKMWFKELNGGEIPSTMDNLLAAAEGENYEWTDMYKGVNVKDGLVFSREGDRIWQCRHCGHIVIGKEAPRVCPVCNHPQSYFEIKKENY